MSLAATLTQNLRAQYHPDLDKNEVRASRYGAWDHFKMDSMRPQSILSQDMKAKIDGSFGKDFIQVPVLDADEVTIGNTRSCTIADDDNTSAFFQVTFATYAFGFSMYKADYVQNELKYQQDYDRKLRKYLLKLASIFDTAAVNQLEADKNVFAGGGALAAYYPVVGNSLQIPQAEKNDFYNNLEAIKETQDFYDRTHVIHNPAHKPLVKRLDNQGSNNGTNESFQLDGYNWMQTNRIANGAGVESTGFAATENNCGLYWRNDQDAVNREMLADKEWDVIQMPIVDIPMASFYDKNCSDRSSVLKGGERTIRESFEFSVDLCYFTAYNSDTANQYGPIQKFEIMST